MHLAYKSRYLILAIFLASFLIGNYADASDSKVLWHLLDALSWVVYWIVTFIGKLIGLIIGIFTQAIEYRGFLTEEPVLIGWTIIRDLCNMGFVVILLIIAIASILQIESYGYRNRLFKILIMAVLINFSKMFTGILIDASQYVMLEFAVGINSIGGGNFTDILRLNTFLSINFSEEIGNIEENKNVDLLDLFVTVLLALVLALVTLVVMTALTLVVIIRIVALWILIILSPVAYLLAFSPVGSKYSSQWWQKFSQWAVTGPVMLFFVWLSLATLKGVMDNMFSVKGDVSVGVADIGTTAIMGSFLLAIVFLMASLVVAQQLGGLAGRVAGGAYNMIASRGERLAKRAVRLPKRTLVDTPVSWASRSKAVKNSLDRVSGLGWSSGGGLGTVAKVTGVTSLARGALGRLNYRSEEEEKKSIAYVSRFDDNPYTQRAIGSSVAFTPDGLARKQAMNKRHPDNRIFEAVSQSQTPSNRDGDWTDRQIEQMTDEDIKKIDPARRSKILARIAINNADAVARNTAIVSYLGSNAGSSTRENIAAVRPDLIVGAGVAPGGTLPSGTDISHAAIGGVHGGPVLWNLTTPSSADIDPDDIRTRYMAGAKPKGKISEDELDIPTHLRKKKQKLTSITGVAKLQGEKGKKFNKNNISLAVNFDELGEGFEDMKNFGGGRIPKKDKGRVQKRLMEMLSKQDNIGEDQLKEIEAHFNKAQSFSLINKGEQGRRGRQTISHEAMHGQLEQADQEGLKRVWDGMDKDKKAKADKEIRSSWQNGDTMSETDVMHEYFADGMANIRSTWAREGGHELDDDTREKLTKLGLKPGSLKEASESETKERREEREYEESQERGYTVKDRRSFKEDKDSVPSSAGQKAEATTDKKHAQEDVYDIDGSISEEGGLDDEKASKPPKAFIDSESLERKMDELGDTMKGVGDEIKRSVAGTGSVGKEIKNISTGYAQEMKKQRHLDKLKEDKKKKDEKPTGNSMAKSMSDGSKDVARASKDVTKKKQTRRGFGGAGVKFSSGNMQQEIINKIQGILGNSSSTKDEKMKGLKVYLKDIEKKANINTSRLDNMWLEKLIEDIEGFQGDSERNVNFEEGGNDNGVKNKIKGFLDRFSGVGEKDEDDRVVDLFEEENE